MVSFILSLILVEVELLIVDSLLLRDLIDSPFWSPALLSDSGGALVVLKVSLLEVGGRGCAGGWWVR